MEHLSTLTKKQLLSLANEHNILGRHDMTKHQLIDAIAALTPLQSETEVDETEAESEDAADAPVVPPLKKRVSMKGVNKSGNVPYRRKPYFLDLDLYEQASDEQLGKAPNQVRLILRAMENLGITDEDSAMIGKDIVDEAKNAGFISTSIPSANLFAYYRRELERFGVTFTG